MHDHYSWHAGVQRVPLDGARDAVGLTQTSVTEHIMTTLCRRIGWIGLLLSVAQAAAATDVFDAVNKRELELGAASMTALVFLLDKYGL